MERVLVRNGQVVQRGLPESGILKNGRIVSGYQHLPEEILSKEGWLPLEEPPAPKVGVNEVAEEDGFEIFSDKVVKKWKIIPRPKPQIEVYRDKIRAAKTLEELKAVLLEYAG